MMPHRPNWVIWAFVLLLIGCQSMVAVTLYVDDRLPAPCSEGTYSVDRRDCSGDDGVAYPAIQNAVDLVAPGTTVVIREGVYREVVKIRQFGHREWPIRLRNLPGERPVIDGTGLDEDALLLIESSRGVELTGLTLRNAWRHGIKVRLSHHVDVTDCEVAYADHGGIVIQDTSHVSVRGCQVHHTNLLGLEALQEGITLSNVDGFEVTRCEVFANGEEGIVAKYGSKNGLIYRNEVYRNNGPNIYLDGVSHIQVRGNLIHSTVSATKPGLGIAVESTFNARRENTNDIHIHSNVIYGNGAGISFGIEEGALDWARFERLRIENNTIHNNNQSNWGAIYLVNGSRSNYGPGNTIRNNLLLDNTRKGGAKAIRDGAGVVGSFTVDHNLFGAGEPSATYGTNAVTADREVFESGVCHTYQLSADSPARDAGFVIPDIFADFDGNARLSGGSPDIGAIESVAGRGTSSSVRCCASSASQ